MLHSIRNMFRSKVGAVAALAFLALIALAFAGGDIAGLRPTTGGASDGPVATVGRERIGSGDLSQATTAALQNIRQNDPTMSMAGFLSAGGLTRVLDNLIDRTAMMVWGKNHGIVASERLIDSEIARMPAFQGPDGKFSQSAFQQLMQQRGISEKLVRTDIAQGLAARQLTMPASFGTQLPRELAVRYAELLTERREGMIAVLPAELFAPESQPDDTTLAAWYKSHQNRFIRPERRTIRYASFDQASLKNLPPPTEAEIAASYQANPEHYAALESRSATQLIVPTEDAARAIVAEIGQGQTLEAAARGKGFATSTLDATTKSALASQTSPALADAVFATARGAIAAPVRGSLGWHVVRVDAIQTRPARSLEQARGEIAAMLAQERRIKALSDMSARIEEEFSGGASLAEVAKEFGLSVEATRPVTADGVVYGTVGESAPAELGRVLETAFAMEENEPQLAEVDPGKSFVLFEVANIAASAPAPFAEIKEDVVAAYMLDRGFTDAGEAAKKVLAGIKAGSELPKALASLGRPVPPAERIAMSREQLAQMQQQSRQPVPPPLALLFSMAQGTTKLLPAPQNRGWFVISLRQITPGKVAADDPLVAEARRELGRVAGEEYAAALQRSIRNEVGVTTNAKAVEAVRQQLAGANGGF